MNIVIGYGGFYVKKKTVARRRPQHLSRARALQCIYMYISYIIKTNGLASGFRLSDDGLGTEVIVAGETQKNKTRTYACKYIIWITIITANVVTAAMTVDRLSQGRLLRVLLPSKKHSALYCSTINFINTFKCPSVLYAYRVYYRQIWLLRAEDRRPRGLAGKRIRSSRRYATEE